MSVSIAVRRISNQTYDNALKTEQFVRMELYKNYEYCSDCELIRVIKNHSAIYLMLDFSRHVCLYILIIRVNTNTIEGLWDTERT